MIGRRPFLIGSVGLAATAVLARPGQPMTGTLAAGLPQSVVLADAAESGTLVLRVYGWDAAEGPSSASNGDAWIHVNSSWRTAWR